MNLQGQLAVSIVLLLVACWTVRALVRRRLSSGQVLFWLSALVGAEVLVISPPLVHRLTVLWGNLMPVSWISFLGMAFLIACLVYQTVETNALRRRQAELARHAARLDRLVREASPSTPDDGDDS